MAGAAAPFVAERVLVDGDHFLIGQNFPNRRSHNENAGLPAGREACSSVLQKMFRGRRGARKAP
jgi:hypothetical protein